jgi:hypothetical protein
MTFPAKVRNPKQVLVTHKQVRLVGCQAPALTQMGLILGPNMGGIVSESEGLLKKTICNMGLSLGPIFQSSSLNLAKTQPNPDQNLAYPKK